MVKSSTRRNRVPAARQSKVLTIRLDPSLKAGLVRLQAVLNKPLNHLVNEAVRSFIHESTAKVESDFRQIAARVKAYRRSDPKFERAIAQFVDAEARFGPDDPAEGRVDASAGPVQAMAHSILRG